MWQAGSEMESSVTNTMDFGAASSGIPRRVLNVGSGPYNPNRLHSAFRDSSWTEVRYDIDPTASPDIVGSITDLSVVSNAAFDAIWCSHNLEHLRTHEVPQALAEFRRVLKPNGFSVITTPDLEAIAELIVDGRVQDIAYQSNAGPVTALDMLFGHSSAIAKGNLYMSHNTGFTADRLGQVLIDSGFAEAHAMRGSQYDLWAVALMPEADKRSILHHLREHKLDLFPDDP
jgi:SAM-dependent methyltransferase